jgi:hypothetical protein
VIPRHAAAFKEIVSNDVIDITVLVIIDSVFGDFTVVAPDVIPGDILMIPVQARIDDGYGYRTRLSLVVPG